MGIESLASIGMSDPTTELLDSTRLLFDLQQGSEIAQSFSGCLEPEAIACQTTDGLVEKFDCAFARSWLVDLSTRPDQLPKAVEAVKLACP
jgi:hypothetical protein